MTRHQLEEEHPEFLSTRTGDLANLVQRQPLPKQGMTPLPSKKARFCTKKTTNKQTNTHTHIAPSAAPHPVVPIKTARCVFVSSCSRFRLGMGHDPSVYAASSCERACRTTVNDPTEERTVRGRPEVTAGKCFDGGKCRRRLCRRTRWTLKADVTVLGSGSFGPLKTSIKHLGYACDVLCPYHPTIARSLRRASL